MDKEKLIPSLRFSEYNYVWEQRKAQDIFKSVADKGYPELPVLSASQEFGMIKRTDTGINIHHDASNEIGYKRVMPGQFVIHLRSFQGGFAHSATEGITSPAYTVFDFQEKENHYDYFWKYIFNSDRFIKSLELITYGIRDGRSISFDDFTTLDFYYPSYVEQKQIGQFFQRLDNFITLHQNEYDKLLIMKKAMLEKMFPKKGMYVPEIRFKGFTGPWKMRKFTDITYPAGEKNRDNLPLESYSITNGSGFVPQNEKFENGGTMKDADKTMYYIVSPNSFAYNPARINVGSIGYQNLDRNVIVSSLYEVFKTSEDVDDRFLWHWFKSDAFQKMIEQYQEGGVRLYFYYDKLCMCSLAIPSVEEQRKIGEQLDAIDYLITLHQCKLEKLKNIKAGCLEKMFV